MRELYYVGCSHCISVGNILAVNKMWFHYFPNRLNINTQRASLYFIRTLTGVIRRPLKTFSVFRMGVSTIQPKLFWLEIWNETFDRKFFSNNFFFCMTETFTQSNYTDEKARSTWCCFIIILQIFNSLTRELRITIEPVSNTTTLPFSVGGYSKNHNRFYWSWSLLMVLCEFTEAELIQFLDDLSYLKQCRICRMWAVVVDFLRLQRENMLGAKNVALLCNYLL